MPTYLTPGVYAEELPSAGAPIEGVGVSVAGFVGLAPGGPVHQPVRVSSWNEFAAVFSGGDWDIGPFMEDAHLAHAVLGYFQNGGSACWVVRVADLPGPPEVVLTGSEGEPLLRARAVDDGQEPIWLEVREGASGYRVVARSGDRREEWDDLTLDRGPDGMVATINRTSMLVVLDDLRQRDRTSSLRTDVYTLAADRTAAPGRVRPEDLIGDESERRGLGSLSVIDEVSMVAVPDLVATAAGDDDISLLAAQQALIAHCEMAGDRLAILDPPAQFDAAVIHEWRINLARYDSKFATLYWPWVVVTDPLTSRPIAVPPSGHVAGVWARVDAQRGVHKAPANEVVRGIVDLASHITAGEQAPLNSVGINCMRAFAGRGIRIWGARTLSSDPEWRELGVRRLVTHVSDTIARGTSWATFEPNDERLWLQLRVAVANYLTRLWRDGALVGRVPAEAFFVKCDQDTNPRAVTEAGQLVIEVGLALAHAAEFVVFRISHARSAALGVAS
jgi:uncharacterized protein